MSLDREMRHTLRTDRVDNLKATAGNGHANEDFVAEFGNRITPKA
jgi:hypothetical protein